MAAARTFLAPTALALSALVAALLPAFTPAAEPGSPQLPAGLRSRASAAGTYLLDARGMSLYVFAQDVKPGESACTAECAKNWPPLRAETGARAVPGFDLVPRGDGAPQWSQGGRPLYAYAREGYPGSAYGDRSGNAWNLAFIPARLPPGIALRSLYIGRVLADGRGMTLYWTDEEAPRSGSDAAPQHCRERCPEEWRPLAAPLLANPVGECGIAARSDGSRQWTWRGHRLYTYARESKPGELQGEGAAGGWHAALIEPAAGTPDWVTVQRSDMGEIFADARGMTLYTLTSDLTKVRQTMCDDACIARYWRHVPAAANARPVGDWAPIDDSAGHGRIWAYRGNALWTHLRDRQPGAIGGDKWAAGVGGGGAGWMPIQRRRDLDE